MCPLLSRRWRRRQVAVPRGGPPPGTCRLALKRAAVSSDCSIRQGRREQDKGRSQSAAEAGLRSEQSSSMLATGADCCNEAVAMRSRGPTRAKSAAAAAAAAATTSPIRSLGAGSWLYGASNWQGGGVCRALVVPLRPLHTGVCDVQVRHALKVQARFGCLLPLLLPLLPLQQGIRTVCLPVYQP